MTHHAEKEQPQEGEAAVMLHVQTGSRVGVCGGEGAGAVCFLPSSLIKQFIPGPQPTG